MSTKKVKNNKNIKIEPMTILQFRSKLEGIEMFQSEDWFPTKEQWVLIREMINNIIEESYEQNYKPQTVNNYQPVAPSRPINNFVPLASTINNNPINAATIPSVLDQAAMSTLQQSNNGVEIQTSQTLIKSQNLIGQMNSDGTYDSAFA